MAVAIDLNNQAGAPEADFKGRSLARAIGQTIYIIDILESIKAM